MILPVGIIFALLLGYGAGTEIRKYYGIGFWGSVITVIIGFFQLSIIKVLGLLGIMLLLAFIAWVISLGHKIGRVTKYRKKG